MLRAILRPIAALLVLAMAHLAYAAPQRLRLPQRVEQPMAPTLSAEELKEKQAADEHHRGLAVDALARAEITFEQNVGQYRNDLDFVANGVTSGVMIKADALTLSIPLPRAEPLQPAAPGKPGEEPAPLEFTFLEMQIAGASPHASATGVDPSDRITNYYRGHEAEQQFEGVPHFDKVRYEGVYPDTDLVYYGRNGRLEYDFVLAPGADATRPELRFEGADGLRIDDETGDLLLSTAAGDVRQSKPYAYQTIDGAEVEVAASFERRGDDRIGFRVADYDRAQPLIIDPILYYATGLGGPGNDLPTQVAVDENDNVYISGSTTDPVWPALPQSAGLNEDGGPRQTTAEFIGFILFMAAVSPDVGPNYLRLAAATFLGAGLAFTVVAALAYFGGTLYAAGATKERLPGMTAAGPNAGNRAFVAALVAATLAITWLKGYGENSEATAIQVIQPAVGAVFLAVAVVFLGATFLGVNRGFGEQGGALMTLGIVAGALLSVIAFYLERSGTQMGISGLSWLLVGTTIYLMAYGAASGALTMAGNSHSGGWDGFLALFTISAVGILAFASLHHIGTALDEFMFGAKLLLIAGALHVFVGLISNADQFFGIRNLNSNGYNTFLALFALAPFLLVTGAIWGILGAGSIFGGGLSLDRWNNLYVGLQVAAAVAVVTLVGLNGVIRTFEDLDHGTVRLQTPAPGPQQQESFNAGILKFNFSPETLAVSVYYALIIRALADMRLVTIIHENWENPLLVGWFVGSAPPVTENAVQTGLIGGSDLFLLYVKQPNIFATSILGAASFAGGFLTPCMIITIFGHWIGPKQLALFELDADGQFPDEVGGTQVMVNGTPQSMIYASKGQISAILSCDIEDGPAAQPAQSEGLDVWVEYNGQQSNVVQLPVQSVDPQLFTVAQTGVGKVAAINQDGSINSADNPADVGSTVALYGTGGGVTDPYCDTAGLASVTELQPTVAQFSAAVGGMPATLVFSGNAPGFTCGLNQWNVTIPEALTAASANQEEGVTTICVRLPSGEVIDTAISIAP